MLGLPPFRPDTLFSWPGVFSDLTWRLTLKGSSLTLLRLHKKKTKVAWHQHPLLWKADENQLRVYCLKWARPCQGPQCLRFVRMARPPLVPCRCWQCAQNMLTLLSTVRLLYSRDTLLRLADGEPWGCTPDPVPVPWVFPLQYRIILEYFGASLGLFDSIPLLSTHSASVS